MRPLNPDIAQALGDSFNYSRAGEEAVRLGNWAEARADYQNALALVPNNQQALYGMAQCAEAAGDTATALKYYRADIYSHDNSRYGTVPGDGYQDNMPDNLMNYVILLSKVGEEQEAISIYNRAASLLNYDDGQPCLKVMLPGFAANSRTYTPQRLQAMARVAISIVDTAHGDQAALPELKQAISLAPRLGSCPILSWQVSHRNQ